MRLFQKRLQFKILKGLGALALLLLINYGSSKWNFSVDLTKEKRFTLAQITQQMVRDLEHKVVFTVYLEPNVNPGFRRLYVALNQMLGQLKKQNKSMVDVQFVVVDKLNATERSAFNKLAQKYEMHPINVVDEDNSGKLTQKAVYPWVLVEYNKKVLAVNLLQNVAGKSSDENLNSSIENLEFQIVDALRVLSIVKSERIAFLEGHGELDEDHVYDITTSLSRYFSIDRGRIGNSIKMLTPYKALIIAAPKTPFRENEKFIIDQYLMQGGKILWLVDGVHVEQDSLQISPYTLGLYNDVNLADLLFSYGVRISSALVMDLQCARIAVNVAAAGATPNFKPLPWMYAPIFASSNLHPVTKNVSPIKGEFSSTIDLVAQNSSISKTVVLATGRQTKLEAVPVQIDMNQIMNQPNVELFNKSYLPVAAILEGVFSSAFENRMPPNGVDMEGLIALKKSVPTKMMVVSDGSIIGNEVKQVGDNRRIYPLGYDEVAGRILYGNADFILNAVNFLTDETGIVTLRNRSIPIRLLDKKEANNRRYFWQIVNIGGPLLLLFALAFVVGFFRHRKYSSRL